MYPSDYGYASINTICRNNMNKPSCLNTNWVSSSRVESKIDTLQYNEWLLSPGSSGSNGASDVFLAYSTGLISSYPAANGSYATRPTLYLKSTTLITSGSGTSSDPYIIV